LVINELSIMNFAEGEVLLINKPSGWTSFDVVNKLRFAISRKEGQRIKVGHAGTLDPLATGLLIICTGKMTKRIDEYSGMDKQYTGTFFIGATTPTYDSEMEIDASFPSEHIDDSLIEEVRKKFLGITEQVPPVFSAIKLEGKVAYQQARKGKEVVMKARSIEIKQLELTRIALPEIDFRVICTKGTYIRSLAFDFGRALQSGGYLKSLCRTKIGEFDVKDALTVDEFVTSVSAPGN
jgi:tRNA pseudouridine55 synthase